jgi:uncharacterized cupin superfamily protein
MAYNHVDLQDVEADRGVFYKMRRELGVEGFGINYIEVPPDAEGMEHDETMTGHEEVYVILDGSGTMRIGPDEVALVPGRWLRVDAAERRQVLGGPGGMKMIMVGGTPGRPFAPREGL